MNALVNFINEISSNLTIDFDYTLTEKFIDLLKEKIETRISEKEPVIIYVHTDMVECRNTILIDDYEFNDDMLYFNNGNYEIHICFDKAEIKYDTSFDESFIFTYDNMEVGLIFP